MEKWRGLGSLRLAPVDAECLTLERQQRGEGNVERSGVGWGGKIMDQSFMYSSCFFSVR